MTVAGETHRCPPHEVLAAFVDARLPRTQVVALSEHLATCAECRFVVESASELQAEEQAESIEPQVRRSWRWLAVAAVVGVVVLSAPFTWTTWQENKTDIRELVALKIRTGAAWVKSPRTYRRDIAVRELIAAADSSNVRIIEPRITGFGYGPPPRRNRGGVEDEPDVHKLIVDGKAFSVLINTETDPSPEAAHARGIASLVLGRNGHAITELTAATQKLPNNAQTWNDLSAAYYVNRKYMEAFDAASRATKIDPKLSDAWFNRALAVAGIATTDPVVKYRWAKKSPFSAEYVPLAQEPLVQMIVDGKATEVLRMTEGKRTPDAIHARGIAHLVLQQKAEAIDELTAVTKARPDDVRVWTDLAAALLANHDYKQALVAARRAHYLDSLQPETLANLKAAYERSGDAEIAAWTDYLKHDSTSKWAEEVRQKLKDLQEPS
jgi:Flp pilus assembly protein TadD